MKTHDHKTCLKMSHDELQKVYLEYANLDQEQEKEIKGMIKNNTTTSEMGLLV